MPDITVTIIIVWRNNMRKAHRIDYYSCILLNCENIAAMSNNANTLLLFVFWNENQ